MPIVNRVADLHAEIAAWRRDIHANPELLYDVHRTAASVADKLKSFGCDEVVTGIGRTGVVGVIRGRTAGSKAVGLRADMDALPIEEATGLPYKSTVPGKMHACGHDGHTAMLLDGLIDRFGIQEVFGMHNYPGMPIGRFGIRSGPAMASTDTIGIRLEGVGAHAAFPHTGVDTILAGAQIVNQLQSIVSRNVDPVEAAVVSICTFHGGEAENVIPQQVRLGGTVRTLSQDVRDLVQKRVREVVEGTARLYGAKAQITYTPGYPVLVNNSGRTAFAASVAREIAGDSKVDDQWPPLMGAEDFAFMLNERPGAFIYVGNGDSAGLHNPKYDFNDEAIPLGTSYWVRLAETALAG